MADSRVYKLSAEDRERERNARAAWRAANPNWNKNERVRSQTRERQRRYRARHPEDSLAHLRKWQRSHPDELLDRNRRRRIRRLGIVVVPYKRLDIFERDRWICQLCRKKINRRRKWPDPLSASLDHIVPLAAPGSVDAPWNVQLAHLRCNCSKNARPTTRSAAQSRRPGERISQ